MPDTATDFILEGEELQAEGPCVEEGAGVVVPPKGGLFDSDGQATLAIIRPCVSRGKRLRGLPPIYEPQMLGSNARVFEDWHMWMGHMSIPLKEALEELEERLQEAVTPRRLFSELGGRITKTWFDPTFTTKTDEEMGYRPGAVMGKAIPYPASKQILEADPRGLHVSIAAWPTSARRASASWDPGQTGMAVEGFRRTPRGSVDWVLRGGAGGHPVAGKLSEAEQRAVTTLGTYYDARPRSTDLMPDWKNMTLEQLKSELPKDNPELAKSLGLVAEAETPKPPSATAALPAGGMVSMEELERRLAEQRATLTTEFTSKLGEARESVEEEFDERLTELREAEANAKHASTLIKKAGLPSRWTEDLLRRYSILPSGPSQALLVEEEQDAEGKTLTERQVLEARVGADIQHARDLIQEAGGSPGVRGLGGGEGTQRSQKKTPRRSAFRDFLRESGDELGEKPEDENNAIREMVQEGIH